MAWLKIVRFTLFGALRPVAPFSGNGMRRLGSVFPFRQAATVTLHITQFDGGNAISAFRAQQLTSPSPQDHQHFCALCAPGCNGGRGCARIARAPVGITVCDPFEGSASGVPFIVTPHMGTISPCGPQGPDIALVWMCSAWSALRNTVYFLLGGKPSCRQERASPDCRLAATCGLRVPAIDDWSFEAVARLQRHQIDAGPKSCPRIPEETVDG